MIRLVHALAALIVAMLALVVPGTPVYADPQPQSTALCTVQEWQVPANFADCAKRLATAGAQRIQCIQAPTPSSPDAGVAGWLTSRPDADLRSGVVGMYTRYGVGGYRLETYDTGCADGVTHPASTFENSIASMEFSLATVILGAANGLRDYAYNPGATWAWSDDFVTSLTQAAFDHIFLVFGVIAAAVAALWLLWKAPNGSLSHAVRTAGWALIVMVVMTAVAKWPLAVAHGFDTAGTGGLAAVHNVLGPGPDDIPAGKCVFVNDPEACKDHRTTAVRASDSATEAILYHSWLRAELGSDTSETAKKYGPALYDATTFTWGEAADMRAHPELRQTIVAEKAGRWLAVAEQIKAEDPEAYANLQGLRGTDRVGSGLVAVLSALIFAVFDGIASVVILLAFGVIRFSIILAPVVGTWGVLEPASNGLRKMVDRVITSLFNIIRFGSLSGLYLFAAKKIYGSTMPGFMQVVAVGLCGLACWLALRPLGKLRSGFARRPDEGDSEAKSGRFAAVLSAVGWVAKVAADSRRGHGDPIHAEASAGRPRRPESRALPSGGAR